MPFSSGITLSIFFSFYMNSFLHAENPAGQVMMGKMVPKMDPSPHPHYVPSIAGISAEVAEEIQN